MIRTAVIGAGHLGQYHAEKYASFSKSKLVAVVDILHEKAQKLARKHSARALQDFQELETLDIQCVSIASDTKTHFEVASWCIQHGMDVLLEKPMTTSTKEARALIELALKHERILQVGHLERFNPAFKAVLDVLNNPRFFEVRRIAQFTGRGHDVDVVLDLMIHDIDIVMLLVDRPLLRVEAIGVPVLTSSIDIANARLTFDGGAIANVTASRAAFKSERSLRIFQPDLYVSLDFGKKTFKISRRGKGLDLLGFPKILVEEHVFEEGDALRDEIESFLECVSMRTKPLVSGEDGLKAIELAERIRGEIENTALPKVTSH